MHRARGRRVLLEHVQRGRVVEPLAVFRGNDARVCRAPEVEPVRPLAVGHGEPPRAVGRLVVEDEDPVPLAVGGERVESEVGEVGGHAGDGCGGAREVRLVQQRPSFTDRSQVAHLQAGDGVELAGHGVAGGEGRLRRRHHESRVEPADRTVEDRGRREGLPVLD